MYVLLVLQCLNAVFMQVVSRSSVRVVPGVTLVAGWRWPGPLPWSWCAGAALSAQWGDRRGPVRSSSSRDNLHTVTHTPWPGPHNTWPVPGVSSGDMQHLLHQCGGVAQSRAGAGLLLLPGPSRISFIHSSTVYSLHRRTALTASLPAAAGPVKAHCDTVCAPPIWYSMQCQTNTNTYSTDGAREASCCRHCKYLDCPV